MDELSLRLAAGGIPVVRMDSDRCLGEPVQWDPASRVLVWRGERFTPVLSWLRYFTPESMACGDPAETLYAREQWTAFVTALRSVPRAINPSTWPGVPDRLTQLKAARNAGLRVPASLVTTRLADAAAAIPGDGDLLVKSLGRHMIEDPPGRMRGLFPRRVPRCEVAREHTAESGPVLVQEFVESVRELRVHVVGESFSAYAVTRPTPDSLWTRPDLIVAESVTLPPALIDRLTKVSRMFGLDVGGFDLLETAHGEPVFLEVNPEGSWLWVERLARSSETSQATWDLITRIFREEDR
jgi:glutathione synthase/RimK-type ligase-like ATP-grasp enzyme